MPRNTALSLVGCLAVTLAVLPATAASSAAAPVYYCFGVAATIVGTPGEDILIGQEDTADVIVGLGGNDTIFGAEDVNARTAPGDRLCGGPGNDTLGGGVGEDYLDGGWGDDDVDGSFGYDVIAIGGPGNDRVTDCDSEYDAGTRVMIGGPGDDYLCADVSDTRMYGNSGDDELVDLDCFGEARMYGGTGNDVLRSHFHNFEGLGCTQFGIDNPDHLSGGPGVDQAIVSPNDLIRTIEEILVG